LWDYDLTAAPKLLTVKHDGKNVDIVAEAGKNGFLYVFDRVTGKPLWPIEERPVPKSDMPGEEAWTTQPFPTMPPPFARQKFTADDIDPYIADPAERARLRDTILSARNEGLFTPPGMRDTIEMPGNNGGGNWGATAVDPARGMLYVESKDAPSMLKLEPKPPKRQMTGSAATQGKIIYLQNCQTCHGPELKGQPPAVPSLVGVIDRVGADRVKAAVTTGLPPMPAFPDLTSDEITSLTAFLKAPGQANIPPDVLAFLSTPPPQPPPTLTNGTPPVRYWTGYGYMNSSEGYPAIKPPWSTLTAYDMNAGSIKWQVPLGEVAAAAEKGIKETGSFWPRGGLVVTGGGLIFVGTKSDNKVRAYDQDTGKVLWERELPAGPEGVPAIFEVKGREFLAISARPATASGSTEGRPPQRSADAKPPAGNPVPSAQPSQTQGYYVFAIPERSKVVSR
jgi:quinoprotein glucose dehydrogenase